jgi:predicted RNA-binding protein with TRAM domain
MREKKPSVETPRRLRRSAKFLAGLVGLTMSAVGSLVAITALPASATVTTANYTIGTPTGAVTGAAVTPTSVVSGANTSWTVSFTTPAALGTNATITVSSSEPLSSAPSSAYLLSGSCLQVTGYTSTTSGITFTVSCSSGISAGATVQVVFNAEAPTSNFNFAVSTSANSTADDTNTVTVSSVPPSLSASSVTNGAGVVYSITDVGANGATGGSWATLTGNSTNILELTSSGALTSTAISWDTSGPSDYTVTYTPPGGTATADSVSAISPLNSSTPTETVYLGLANAIPQGSTVNITADGTNPSSPGASVTVSITPFTGSSSSPGSATEVVGPTETTGSLTFGAPVTAPTLSISSLVSSATASYIASFIASGPLTGGTANEDQISFSESTGPTNFGTVTGVLVSDATAGWHFVTTTSGTAAGDFSGSSGSLTVYLPAGDNVASGDSVTVTIVNVTNPGAGTYSDFSISTSGNPVSANVPAYTIGASGVAAPTVTVNPNSTGSVATYTISGLYANAALTGGSTANEIALTAPAGTVFPNVSSDYMLTDSTTSSGSGTFTLAFYAGNYVILVPPNNINSGDALTITIEDVINPSTASSDYNITLTGNVGEATTAVFPNTATSYPNGAIVNFSGTFYVFAGGHAFGVPSPKVLLAIQKVDKATVINAPTGTKVPTTAAAAGTIITTSAVNGSATIYVVGTDGDLHGFSTPQQLVNDGYDTALNVTVPNLGGMTVGSTAGVAGSSVNAASTSANGAILNSSGTFYVLAGGRAFGIPTQKALAAIQATDKATVLKAAVGTTLTSASVTNGVLVTSVAKSPVTVYTTYLGYLWPFKSMNQLKAQGYGGTASVPIWGLGGVAVVSTYTLASSSSGSSTTTTTS